MNSETLLTKTKDNHIIVFTINYNNDAEKTRLMHECENLCRNIRYNEFDSDMIRSPSIVFDANNTNFLHKEISGYHYRKSREAFFNGMKTVPPAKNDTLSLYPAMEDSFFSDMIKNIGYRIEPSDKTYEVRYDPEKDEFIAENFVKTAAVVSNSPHKMVIIRNHFHFLPEDYRRLQQLQVAFLDARRNNKNLTEDIFIETLAGQKKDYALYSFYLQQKNIVRHLDTTIKHEEKHIENDILESGLSLKKDTKRLSVDNYYRLPVEEERSPYLRELVYNINEYLMKGDLYDFSMFNGNNIDFVLTLKSLKPEDRVAYVTNWPRLVAEKMDDFKKYFSELYDDQFRARTEMCIGNAPLEAQEDTDESEFKKIRSLLYINKIYNPHTQRMEMVDLSQYITPEMEVQIDDKVRRSIIEPQQERLNSRLHEYRERKARGEVNPALIEPAKALMRTSTKDSAFITEIDNFRVASLYEDENNSGTSHIKPSSAKIPCDRAGWSNNLKEYWQKFDGFKELAKNNEEFKFKVKDTTVRYTSRKEVHIGKQADYDLYVKLLREPSTTHKPIEFLDTLSKEQALLLYVACVNNGRRMTGAVPKDLSGIEQLQGIPPAELNKFKYRANLQNKETNTQNTQQRQKAITRSPSMLQMRQNIR